MSVQFLTNITEEEFKGFLKEALLEILSEKGKPKVESEELMDIHQAAEYLKLRVNTLYEKTSRKLIPHIKKGNKLYFERSVLEMWLKQGNVKTLEEIRNEAATIQLIKRAA